MWQWAKIICFLGYDPSPQPATLGKRSVALPREHGLSRRSPASTLSVDEDTLWRWETGKRQLNKPGKLQPRTLPYEHTLCLPNDAIALPLVAIRTIYFNTDASQLGKTHRQTLGLEYIFPDRSRCTCA